MPKDLTEQTIASERLYEGRVVNLRIDTVRLPDGRTSKREIVEHRGAVAVVPLLPDGKVILLRQFRHATGETILEIPAGTLDPNEPPERCAERELQEETGFKAGKMEKLAAFYLAPGYSSEMLHAYLATELVKAKAELDEDEFVEHVIVQLDEAVAMIEQGQIKDAKTIAALMLTLLRRSGILRLLSGQVLPDTGL